MTAHDDIRTDLETTADAIDRAGEVFGRGIISPRELVDRIGFFVGRFLSQAIASAAEVQLIVDYGRAATERSVAHTDTARHPATLEPRCRRRGSRHVFANARPRPS